MSQEVKCSCKHAFQDREYGKGMRAVTPMNKSKDSKSGKVQRVRCTVCAAERNAPEGYEP